jgi:hypothetical protein
LVFLGILPTDTEGKLGWYISVLKQWREPPFPLEEGGFGPLFVHFAPLLRKKGIPTEFFKKRVPGKSSKGIPAKAYSTKIPTRYTNRPVLVIYRYRPGGGYKDGIQL